MVDTFLDLWTDTVWNEIAFLIPNSHMKYEEWDFKQSIYTQHKEEVFKMIVKFPVLECIRFVLEHICCGYVERM